MTTSSEDRLPDKGYLYGNYQGQRDWRDRFAKQLAFKSQDLMDDDMQINQTRTGLGWKELAVIVSGLLGGGGLTAYAVSNVAQPPAAVAPAPPSTAESAARVRVFWGDKEILPGGAEQATITESD